MANKKEKGMSELKISAKYIKNSFKSSWQSHKGLWIAGIVIAIILILLSAAFSYVSSEKFIYDATEFLIPKQITSLEEEDYDITFYRETNPDFIDSDTKIDGDNYISLYNYYYFNDAGEKIYLDDGAYHYTDENGEPQVAYVALGFVYQAGEKIGTILTIFKVIGWVLVCGFIVALIVLWYRKDKQITEAGKHKPQPRKSKKK